MRIPIQRYWNLLARYMLPQRWSILVLVISLFVGIGLRLIVPQLVGWFIDTANNKGSLSIMLTIAAGYVAVGLADQVMSVVTLYLGKNISWVATNQMRADVMVHCLQMDLVFHHAHTPGEMIERVDGDVKELSNFFSQFAVQLLGNLLLIFGVLIVLLVKDWRIGLVFVIFSGLALLIFSRVRTVSSPYWEATRQANADLYGFMEERLGGINDIRANGANTYVRLGFIQAARKVFSHNRTAVALSVLVGNGSELILVLGSISALAVAAILYQAGVVTIGTVFLITAYSALITRPLQEIIGQVDDLQKATASITRVEELMHLKPIIQDGRGEVIPEGPLALAFENVSFTYGLEPTIEANEEVSAEDVDLLSLSKALPVLHSISFALKPGEVLGLIGRTGSGKSTLIRLLLRLYDPSSGQITLGGVDLRDTRLEDLRSHIGLVTQDVHHFNASLRDNLTLFDSTVADETILKVLQELGLGEWLGGLAAGLETILPADGGLSAGEAQLLAVVRVFLKNPGLIILDEASSRLDPITEHLLEKAFDRLLVGRTAIIIAHRLHTVQRADTIMLIKQGSIQEYGPRELLTHDKQSQFYQLLQLGLEEIAELKVS